MEKKTGKILIIGFGPGNEQHMTFRAKEAILESDSVIGYNTYIDIVRPLLTNQHIIRTGMTEEVSRAQEAVKQAKNGWTVAVISSGDAGVYGMAGLVYEVLIEDGWTQENGIDVEIIPGVSAIHSCASLLGAPVMHDACMISLSDHLTPWELIKTRVEKAAEADFVIALYNPKSGRRTKQIVETQKILLNYRSPETPVGLVKSAYRERQHVVVTDLAHMLDHEIGMLTTVIIGNSSTFLYDGKMITPRGYQRKYTLNSPIQKLKPNERLKPESEPWAMHGEKKEKRITRSSAQLAEEALEKLHGKRSTGQTTTVFKQESIFEFAVSLGVDNKKMTAQQMQVLAEIVGDQGSIEYSHDHELKVSIKTDEPDTVIDTLKANGFLLSPVGDVVKIKACDFCDGDKDGSIPQARELYEKIGGLSVPKELKIGFDGCAMSCYQAVAEDIGIIYRRKKFDLFLGAKTTGRNAHVGQPVAEGIEPEKLVDIVVSIVEQYRSQGLPNERFHKFFKRVGEVQGFRYREVPVLATVDTVCGDG